MWQNLLFLSVSFIGFSNRSHILRPCVLKTKSSNILRYALDWRPRTWFITHSFSVNKQSKRARESMRIQGSFWSSGVMSFTRGSLKRVFRKKKKGKRKKENTHSLNALRVVRGERTRVTGIQDEPVAFKRRSRCNCWQIKSRVTLTRVIETGPFPVGSIPTLRTGCLSFSGNVTASN